MKKIKIPVQHTGKFFMKPFIKNLRLFIIVLTLFSISCSKDLKAGDPIPLTYNQVYMVGNATSIGWDINKAIPMNAASDNTNEFSWEGTLYAGEIKFPTALSWSSDTFMSATSGQSVSDNKALLALSGNPDYHWKLSDADTGTYKIMVNTKDQTVTFQKE